MNILIDICHPSHVHLFKYSIRLLQQDGHNVIVTVKDIPVAKQLLEQEHIDYLSLEGTKRDSLLGKGLIQLKYNYLLTKIARKYHIDIGIGSSVTVAQIARWNGFPSLFFDDDDDYVEPLTVRFAHSFASIILSPKPLEAHRKKRPAIFYPGSHELAYLHPNRFRPDPSVMQSIGLQLDEPFFVMRFNAFKAHHDGNVQGLTLEQKLDLINILAPHGKVLITTERNIEPELAPYQMKISPDKVHHLLYYATLFVGDSQTMTSEAAILGTPAFRCNSLVGQLAVIEELENRYNLAYGFTTDHFTHMTETIRQLLNNPNLKKEWQTKREYYLTEKIDVTAFLVWFIEHYPKSEQIVLDDPSFPLSFR